ncbi:restriction endonuclease [Lysobacter silvisoli]|uniref:Restriction endonuclease n=1 Tax=Lysobacter silvisoli TaxID=2293254 RepID=A0A371K2M9_9GAMM|nr:restriction endonuclease [Lysobacter silvisoli]RDZ28176.1 restriction endonuclease [Lysobacter silvisoli]
MDRRSLKPVRQRHDDALTRIPWDRFEALLAAYYRVQGYQVEHVGTGAGGARFDGGIDLKLRRDDAYVLVQCKHWNANQVTHNAVHELLGLMVNEGATGAVLISSGEFTDAAQAAAQRQGHVQLIDGVGVRAMLAPLSEAAALFEPQPIAAQSGWGGDPAAALALAPAAASAPRRRPRGSARSANLGWWIATLVGVLIFTLLVRALLERTAWSAGAALGDRAAAEPASPADPVPSLAPVQLEWPSDPPATGATEAAPASSSPTAAEIRESQRKADEAMRVIEASTPEMQQ